MNNKAVYNQLSRYLNEGQTDELASDLLILLNKTHSRIASEIGISVFELPNFYAYFHQNLETYIQPSSPVYTQLHYFQLNPMPVERIRVVCNGLHCNNPGSSTLRGWILFEFVLNGVGATQSADVSVVNNAGAEYSNSSGIWRNNGMGDIELVNANCSNCKLN